MRCWQTDIKKSPGPLLSVISKCMSQSSDIYLSKSIFFFKKAYICTSKESMARLLPRGVSENRASRAKLSLRTAACSDATEWTADSLPTGHDISVFWFSSKSEGKLRISVTPLQAVSRRTSSQVFLPKTRPQLSKALKFQGVRSSTKKPREMRSFPYFSVVTHPHLICKRLEATKWRFFDSVGWCSKSEAVLVCFPQSSTPLHPIISRHFALGTCL